jgi:hypothetical protein
MEIIHLLEQGEHKSVQGVFPAHCGINNMVNATQIKTNKGVNSLHAAQSLPISLIDPFSFRSSSVGLIATKA